MSMTPNSPPTSATAPCFCCRGTGKVFDPSLGELLCKHCTEHRPATDTTSATAPATTAKEVRLYRTPRDGVYAVRENVPMYHYSLKGWAVTTHAENKHTFESYQGLWPEDHRLTPAEQSAFLEKHPLPPEFFGDVPTANAGEGESEQLAELRRLAEAEAKGNWKVVYWQSLMSRIATLESQLATEKHWRGVWETTCDAHRVVIEGALKILGAGNRVDLETVAQEVMDQLAAKDARIAELEAKLADAERERDSWRNSSERHYADARGLRGANAKLQSDLERLWGVNGELDVLSKVKAIWERFRKDDACSCKGCATAVIHEIGEVLDTLPSAPPSPTPDDIMTMRHNASRDADNAVLNAAAITESQAPKTESACNDGATQGQGEDRLRKALEAIRSKLQKHTNIWEAIGEISDILDSVLTPSDAKQPPTTQGQGEVRDALDRLIDAASSYLTPDSCTCRPGWGKCRYCKLHFALKWACRVYGGKWTQNDDTRAATPASDAGKEGVR